MQGRALVIAALLLLVGSHADAQTRYVSRSLGVSFQPPAGWKPVKSTPIPALVTYALPSKDKFATNITVVTEGVGTATLDDYLAETQRQVAQVAKMHVSAPVKIKVGGLDAYVWRGRLTADKEVAIRQAMCVHAGEGYVVSLFALPTTIRKFEPTFDHLLASFKWTKPVGKRH